MTIKQKLSTVVQWAVRVYVVSTLCGVGLFLHQKYIVEFDDIVKYTPTVFVKDVYEKTTFIDFYSFMGTTYENAPIEIVDALFCRGEAGRWERFILPAPKNFTLRVDEPRNKIIDDFNSHNDASVPDSIEVVVMMRELGDELSKENGFAIQYDISKLPEHDAPLECRLKLYYETSTRFFDLPKSVNFFSNIITIK